MTLVGLKWVPYGGYDVHLLPGMSSPFLNQLLYAEDQDPATGVVSDKSLSAMPNLNLSFTANYSFAPQPAHGVVLDPATGEVRVAPSLPAFPPRLHSFIVTATAVQGVSIADARVRICVHRSLVKSWLTPNAITLRVGARNVRFTVLGEFDDGVIGDLSNWVPFQRIASSSDFRHVHVTGSNAPMLSWSAASIPVGDPLPITVDPVTGVLGTAVLNDQASVVAHRGAQPVDGALVFTGQPWTTPVRISQVHPPKGSNVVGPGVAGMGQVPNVLFLPDGFHDDDRPGFERLVRGAVARLTSRHRSRPFSNLRVNYFMAWFPSPSGGTGISILNELYLWMPMQPKFDIVLPVETASKRPPTDNWKLKDLIHHVGLPTPIHDFEGQVPFAFKLDEWRQVYPRTIVTRDRTIGLYDRWLSRGPRRLADEVENPFSTAFGDRPKVDSDQDEKFLGMNPRRLDPADFNAFLDALEGPQGQVLPKVWTTGKDKDLVVILCRSRRRGSGNSQRVKGNVNSGRTIAVSVSGEKHHLVDRIGDTKGYSVVTDTIPDKINHHLWLTLARELARSWALGVEYGGSTEPPRAATVQSTNELANLQARSTLLVAGALRADNIKWGRWPRLARAGVLHQVLRQILNDRWVVTLQSNRRSGFVVGDIVRLRTRPLPQSAAPSDRFEVIAVSGNEVTIRAFPGANVANLDTRFPPRGAGNPGSILMAPVRGPDPNPTGGQYGNDLTMMTDEVRGRINATHNPLNAAPLANEVSAPPFSTPGRTCPNVVLRVPTGATNFPARTAPKPPLHSAWTIGLYENGGGHNCGIYRPTGVCLMHSDSQRGPDLKLDLNDFCLVCRYGIVDFVDPTRHGEVDADFHRRYVVGAP